MDALLGTTFLWLLIGGLYLSTRSWMPNDRSGVSGEVQRTNDVLERVSLILWGLATIAVAAIAVWTIFVDS